MRGLRDDRLRKIREGQYSPDSFFQRFGAWVLDLLGRAHERSLEEADGGLRESSITEGGLSMLRTRAYRDTPEASRLRKIAAGGVLLAASAVGLLACEVADRTLTEPTIECTGAHDTTISYEDNSIWDIARKVDGSGVDVDIREVSYEIQRLNGLEDEQLYTLDVGQPIITFMGCRKQ